MLKDLQEKNHTRHHLSKNCFTTYLMYYPKFKQWKILKKLKKKFLKRLQYAVKK